MASWLQLAAAKHPDRVALETPGGALTYAQLLRAAGHVAGWLDRQRVPSRAPIAVALPPGIDFVIALHGCLLSGHPVQPIDLRLGGEEQRARREGTAIVIDGPLPSEHLTRGAWAGDDPAATAAVLYTSGTTAAPKRVALTYGNFLASALGSAVALGLDQEERWLCPMPLTHVGGLSIPVRSAVYATTAVLHERFHPAAVVEELMSPARRITLISLVPTMLSRLLEAGLERPPTLRWALLGGGFIPGSLLERAAAAGVPVAPTYGMTESCSQIATFGWPLPGVSIRICGGEIAVKGPIVAPGARDEDGWLHTGDLGENDDRGRLRITGRRSDTIITGGENVSPEEVESVLLEHPAVADAAVLGRADAEWGEALVALIVPRDDQPPDPDELRAHCRARLAAFKVPKAIELRVALPRTSSGKLLRRQLA